MTRALTDRENVEIASTCTVKRYQELKADGNKDEIAKVVEKRLRERYIEPIPPKAPKDAVTGFAIMALCCLTIETIEQFRLGESETPRGKGGARFTNFFDREDAFGDLRGAAPLRVRIRKQKTWGDVFYDRVRCGILHQGETKHGWRIHRTGPLFDPGALTINATRFRKGVDGAIRRLGRDIGTGAAFGNAVTKLDFIVENI